MKIVIETIEHDKQRYATAGDWQFVLDEHLNEMLKVRVSRLPLIIKRDISLVEEWRQKEDRRVKRLMEILVGIHEVIEAVLCREAGITDEIVTSFDKKNIDHPDPGSIPGCPYYKQHLIASLIEQMLAHQLQVDWEEYEEVLEAL